MTYFVFRGVGSFRLDNGPDSLCLDAISSADAFDQRRSPWLEIDLLLQAAP